MTETPPFPLAGGKVYVAGHNGMVGRALVRRLEREPVELLTAPRTTLDLTDPAATDAWLQAHRPDIVIIAAARVGGIPYAWFREYAAEACGVQHKGRAA